LMSLASVYIYIYIYIYIYKDILEKLVTLNFLISNGCHVRIIYIRELKSTEAACPEVAQ